MSSKLNLKKNTKIKGMTKMFLSNFFLQVFTVVYSFEKDQYPRLLPCKPTQMGL